MSAELAKSYISVGALLNYIGPDRPEMQFAIKGDNEKECIADLT